MGIQFQEWKCVLGGETVHGNRILWYIDNAADPAEQEDTSSSQRHFRQLRTLYVPAVLDLTVAPGAGPTTEKLQVTLRGALEPRYKSNISPSMSRTKRHLIQPGTPQLTREAVLTLSLSVSASEDAHPQKLTSHTALQQLVSPSGEWILRTSMSCHKLKLKPLGMSKLKVLGVEFEQCSVMLWTHEQGKKLAFRCVSPENMVGWLVLKGKLTLDAGALLLQMTDAVSQATTRNPPTTANASYVSRPGMEAHSRSVRT